MEKNDFIKMCKDAIEKVCEQQYPSVSSGVGCVYKSERGCCIVGHMMPNDEVRVKADSLTGGTDVKNVLESGVWDIELDQTQVNTLSELQLAHDYEESYGFNEELLPIDEARFRMKCKNIINMYCIRRVCHDHLSRR